MKDRIARLLLDHLIYPLEDYFQNWVLTEDERGDK